MQDESKFIIADTQIFYLTQQLKRRTIYKNTVLFKLEFYGVFVS